MSHASHIRYLVAAAESYLLLAALIVFLGGWCGLFYADIRAWVSRGVRWFWSHATRGLALMAVSTVAGVLVAWDWLGHRRRRDSADFTLKGIGRADTDAFTDAIRILHADLVKAAEQAERREEP